jgi:major vault protein
MLKNSELKA